MIKIRILILLMVFGFYTNFIKAGDTANYKPAIVLNLGAGYNWGLVDLGKRFPAFSALQGGAYYKNQKNYIFGLEYNRLLGSQLTIDSLYGGIVGSSQNIIDVNGNTAVIRYYMRGFTSHFYIGKLFNIFGSSSSSKLQINLGGGYIQHRIKLRFDQGLLPQLEGNYAAGYDRLCAGYMITQSVYYNYFNTKSVCVFAGLNCVESFTKSQRAWDYSLNRKDVTNRKDFYIGFFGRSADSYFIKSSSKQGILRINPCSFFTISAFIYLFSDCE